MMGVIRSFNEKFGNDCNSCKNKNAYANYSIITIWNRNNIPNKSIILGLIGATVNYIRNE